MRLGQISGALGLLTANLLLATGAHAQVTASPAPYQQDDLNPSGEGTGDTETDAGLLRIDSAVLFYQEAGGRVRTIEPIASATLNDDRGDVLSLKFTSDTLTGATPNGAAPWKGSQTFITPAKPPGKTMSVTGASGGSTLVTIPGTGTIARQYVVATGALPTDRAFNDQRYAIDLGGTFAWNENLRLSAGGSFSTERDYTSYSGSVGVARDLFHKNTTLSLGLDFEFDQSQPYFGTPTPFAVMSADAKGPDKTKTVSSLVAGITQVVNRYWLTQLNYSIGYTGGYQTDPYSIISVVDPTTGGPQTYLYESRPDNRLRQSVYFGNKIALGPTFADLSVRAYHDSWGINSITAEMSERVPILSWIYVEPLARYYDQSAAGFFHNYLVGGQALPAYASSDSRLGKFSAITWGLKFGFKVLPRGEIYVEYDDYTQSGDKHPAGAIGDLAKENLFSGVNASSLMTGFTLAFE